MTDIFLAPKQYVQYNGILNKARDYFTPFGRRPLILADEQVLSIVQPTLEKQLIEAQFSPLFVLFGEECSKGEVLRLEKISQDKRTDFIVGTGGGKALDTSRALAEKLRLPLITIPTSAATCSAASSVAVIYEKGTRVETIYSKGADLVLVDTGIISKAPAKLLAAGMGDALAKWYEGKPTYDQVVDHNLATQTAMILSTKVKETILAMGLLAKRDVESKRHSSMVEKVIEANILLTGLISGVGGKMFRIAVAHSLLYGLTVLPQIHKSLHGEIVSFGIVVQLCLEKNNEELETILPFFSELGLPLTLEELGLTNIEDKVFWEGIERTCKQISAVQNYSIKVDENKLFQAISEADGRGKEFKKRV